MNCAHGQEPVTPVSLPTFTSISSGEPQGVGGQSEKTTASMALRSSPRTFRETTEEKGHGNFMSSAGWTIFPDFSVQCWLLVTMALEHGCSFIHPPRRETKVGRARERQGFRTQEATNRSPVHYRFIPTYGQHIC